ncbi:aromatic acid exporter family protein [Streptomyces sp. NPDC058657]|uniref:FUSC family protein n=1 Tax=unclassified Streptomyces TaxID=2593676 RepID=UPI003655B4BD
MCSQTEEGTEIAQKDKSRAGAVPRLRASAWRRVKDWFRRPRDPSSGERYTLLLTGKSALAATLAWVIAHDLLGAQSPAFAPFSAVLLMQVTIYRSVSQALRYVGAVTAGVLVQAALAFLGGPDLLTFVLVAVIALFIGRWPALGAQGNQVATAAFFAFSTYISARDGSQTALQLGQIVLLVCVGAVVALVVNGAIVPPLRYRGAEYAIRMLAGAMGELLADMWPHFGEGHVAGEDTARWRARAERLEVRIEQARAELRTARESLLYNPLRLFGRRRTRARTQATFHGYAAVLSALERVLHQLTSLTRSLDLWRQEENDFTYEPFLRRYGAFLHALEDITQVLAAIDEDSLGEQTELLDRLVGEARRCRQEAADEAEHRSLPLTDPTRPYGVLVVEATRLTEELQHTSNVLREHAQG